MSGVLQDTITNTPDRRRAGDLHPQRDRDLHGHDRRHRHGLVLHHARRARRHLHRSPGTFGGDSTLPLQLIPSSSSASFIVTPEPTTLTYTGGTTTQNGQPLTVSGVLTTDGNTPTQRPAGDLHPGQRDDARRPAPPSTTSTGAASCVINVTGQPQGPIPVTDTFGGNPVLPVVHADLDGQPARGDHADGEPGHRAPTTPRARSRPRCQHRHQRTGAQRAGHPHGQRHRRTARRPPTPAAWPPAPSRRTSRAAPTRSPGSFGGDTTTVPTLLPSTGQEHLHGEQGADHGDLHGEHLHHQRNTPTLSATLTSTRHPLPGQTVTFTVGSGSSAQHCSGTTNSSGQGQLQHLHVQPERQPAARHRDLRRQHLLRRIVHVAVDHRDDADLAVGAAPPPAPRARPPRSPAR